MLASTDSVSRREHAPAPPNRSQGCSSSCSLSPSMPEMTRSGENHRNIILVAGFDDFFIADGTSRLDNCPNACLSCDFDAILKREKSVRSHHSPPHPLPCFLGGDPG